jgi:hypothetical protein
MKNDYNWAEFNWEQFDKIGIDIAIQDMKDSGTYIIKKVKK